MNLLKKLLPTLGAFLVIACVFSAGFIAGIKVPSSSKIQNVLNMTATTPLPEEVDFAQFWQAWSAVQGKFVDIDKVKQQDMVYGSISGLMKSLGDPYTVFFNPEQKKDFDSNLEGSFEGVGMEVGLRKDIITVIAPLRGTPAERAGILAGDKIIKIGATSTLDFSVEEAVRLIRGPKGTKIKLTILRNGEEEPKILEIERDVINVPIINTDKSIVGTGTKKINIPNDIFLLQLHSFTDPGRMAPMFRDAVRDMAVGGQSKLILDLRNNPGGYLESAVQIASFFLPQGKIIVQENYRDGIKKIHRSYGYDVFNSLPMVILVNQGSASASEILAGALQEHGIAKIVGEKTFGKGSVQELLQLTEDTSLKITVAKWLTPNGKALSEGGLNPDYIVKLTPENTKDGNDPELEKAIELLKNAQGRLQ